MDLHAPLASPVDDAGASAGPDRFLAELGGRLLADGLPLSGGALTLAMPHPIIARRTFLWRAETGAVIEALGFAGAAPIEAGSSWLAGLGPVQEQAVGADNSARTLSPAVFAMRPLCSKMILSRTARRSVSPVSVPTSSAPMRRL